MNDLYSVELKTDIRETGDPQEPEKKVVVGSRVVIHDPARYTEWLINPDNHRDRRPATASENS